MTAVLGWHIGVYCQNEEATLEACLASVSGAASHRKSLITVLINGSTDSSETVARVTASRLKTPVRIFRIKYGDKANAINTFLYDRTIRSDLYFGVDAYVRVCRDALEELATALEREPRALTATGVAMTGHTEPKANRATVATGGALRGQLYALRGSFVDRMVESGIRLPIGTYRGDGLLGTMAAFDLDPLHQPWTNHRLITVPNARFATTPLSPFRVRDIRRQFRRKIRQTRGKMQNAAIKGIVHSIGFSGLPEHAADLPNYPRPAPDSLLPVRVL